MREVTRCRHMGYSFRLAARVLLYASSHRQDNTFHGLCYTSRGALAGTRNSSMAKVQIHTPKKNLKNRVYRNRLQLSLCFIGWRLVLPLSGASCYRCLAPRVTVVWRLVLPLSGASCYRCLAPRSRYNCCAGVSVNIHSFIHRYSLTSL